MTRGLLWVAAAAVLVACGDDALGPRDGSRESELGFLEIGEVILDRRAPAEHTLRELFVHATRYHLGNGIVHYQFPVRVGTGAFDVVRIHRVVREQTPHHPVLTDAAVFMTHGASLRFDIAFLNPDDPGADASVAVYLASHDIDVWGMDFAWTGVPLETTDFTFMKEWGVERDVDHTLVAMSIARRLREVTGQGAERLPLLGYSYGAAVAYAAGGRETQQPLRHRDIGGIVAVDQAMKFSDAAARAAACTDAGGVRDLLDAGVYHNQDGVTFAAFGSLASTAPDDASPFIPGLTNYQATLFIGASTFVLGTFPSPFWHFVGGVFDPASGLPVDLLYTDPSRWITVLASLPPYMPQLAQYESAASGCDEEDVSIDDHLGEIRVPILYVGAAGAVGTLGDYTGSLTASDDVTNVTVQLQPAGQAVSDYGHGDLFLANDAADLMWDVIRHWLVTRDRDGRHRSKHTRR